jgi:hypothetical protein
MKLTSKVFAELAIIGKLRLKNLKEKLNKYFT